MNKLNINNIMKPNSNEGSHQSKRLKFSLFETKSIQKIDMSNQKSKSNNSYYEKLKSSIPQLNRVLTSHKTVDVEEVESERTIDERSDNENMFLTAVARGNIKEVEKFIELGVNIDVCNSFSRSDVLKFDSI
jgi:hypothetical protein